MNATFLVEIDVDDVSDLAGNVEEITDACENAGIALVSVKPWARPSNPTLLPPL